MRIEQVQTNPLALKRLDYLDRLILPTDDPYPKQGRHWWLVHEDGEGPIGFAGLEVKTPATVFLCRVGVFQRFGGQGIHRKLIRVREAWARKRSYSTVVTYTAPDNLRSANNLIRCGYRLYKPARPDGMLHWTKEL
jgi:GNAT superfamily N-acetyltransferase